MCARRYPRVFSDFVGDIFYRISAGSTADNDAEPVGSNDETDGKYDELRWFIVFTPALVFYSMRLKSVFFFFSKTK